MKRGRRGERGFVLITVLILAVLYLGMMELILIESSQVLREAGRFGSRMTADVLAENAAELAARGLTAGGSSERELVWEEGSMRGSFRTLPGNRFVVTGRGIAAGGTAAQVVVEGRVRGGGAVVIDSTAHSRR